MIALSPLPSSWSSVRTATVPSVPASGCASTRNGPTLPRARNITCDDVPWSRSVPAAPAATSNGGGLEDDELRADVQRGVGRGHLGRELRQHPVPVGPAGAAERLPQRRQVGGVDDLERDVLHLLQPLGRNADADALPLGQRQHPARVVGVDDRRAAVGHLSSLLEHLGPDLEALHVAARVEDLARTR